MTSAMTRCGDWLISTPDWHQSWAVWLVIGLGERLIQKSEMTYLGYKPTISGCQKLPYKASKLTILKKLATKMQTIWPCGGWPWGATNPYTILLPRDTMRARRAACRHAVFVCRPSKKNSCVPDTFVNSVKTNKHIFHRRVVKPLVFKRLTLL